MHSTSTNTTAALEARWHVVQTAVLFLHLLDQAEKCEIRLGQCRGPIVRLEELANQLRVRLGAHLGGEDVLHEPPVSAASRALGLDHLVTRVVVVAHVTHPAVHVVHPHSNVGERVDVGNDPLALLFRHQSQLNAVDGDVGVGNCLHWQTEEDLKVVGGDNVGVGLVAPGFHLEDDAGEVLLAVHSLCVGWLDMVADDPR